MQKLKQIFLISLIGLIFANPVLVLAQTTNTNTPAGGITTPTYQGVDSSITQFLCTPSDPADGHDVERCINKLYRFGISFGAISLVFFLVFAGYMYISGGETGKTKAKGILQNALIGIALLLGSYVILSFINPNLTIIKPIQPPIFSAADLPSCADVGFGDNCVLPPDPTTGASGGVSIIPPCTEGLVSVASLGIKDFSGGLQICKPLGEKLAAIYKNRAGIDWGVTATIDPKHNSPCHLPGNPKAGNCADIGISGNPADAALWDKVCAQMKAGGLTSIGNESNVTTSNCGTAVDKTKPPYDKASQSPSLHVNYTVGGGGGGSTSASGNRPYCIPVQGFLCDHPPDMSTSTYPDHVWTSSHSEIQANLDALKSVCKVTGNNSSTCLGHAVKQVYRPPEYSAHLRSVFEAYALLNGWDDNKVSHYGQYCDGSIQYVKASDVKGLSKSSTAYTYITSHFNTHFASTGGLSSATTCLSDHGKGIAVDFSDSFMTSSSWPNSSAKARETELVSAGLCHNIPLGTNGISKGDGPHFVLKSRVSSGCNWP